MWAKTKNNIALNSKLTFQSSTLNHFGASKAGAFKAVNGNVLPARVHLGMYTVKEEEPYWHVTLPGNYLIDTVVGWRIGRTPDLTLDGPVGDQFVTGAYHTNFYLKEQCVTFSTVTYDLGIDDSYTTISIDPPISADKADIRAYFNKKTKIHLILGEVQVYGYDRINPTCPGCPLLEDNSPSPSQVSSFSTPSLIPESANSVQPTIITDTPTISSSKLPTNSPTVQNLSDKIVGLVLLTKATSVVV